MKFSAKTRYGLLALMDMAAHQETGGPVRLTTKEIALRQGIPERFLEQQITALRNAGLVISQRGASGGCTLARRPDEITVLQVIEALEGPLLAMEPSEEGADEGGGAAIREVLDQAQAALFKVFSEATVAGLARREQELRERNAIMFYL
jgi:Rrf2 family cysteine metabolism transcriptional repressor